MTDDITTEAATLTDDQWRQRLTPDAYGVLRKAGTERAFSGEYWNVWDDGTYHCAGCDTLLFTSAHKFDAGCGWPSFDAAVSPEAVRLIEDRGHGMVRVEARCARCDGHLGHLFDDGPTATGMRFCMNSVSLQLRPG